MRKLKTLLVLSGLAVAVLAGCETKTNTSSNVPDSTPTTSSQVAKELTGIEIAAEPAKKSYFVGDQFDAAGLAVKAVFNTGEKEDLAATAYQLSGFDSATAGEKTITVTYQGKTATFKVTVVALSVESIAIVSEPTKKNYFVGDEFDPAGLAVKAVMNNGSEQAVAAADYALSGFDSATPGEKTVTVTYQQKTASFKVNVEAIVLASIRIAANPTKTSYYQDEEFDAAGLQVKAVMNNGSEEDLAADAYALSGFDSSSAGVKTITVTYQEKTATFDVSIIGKDGIELTSAPDKVRYGVGDEFDATGLVVSQKYADGTKKALDAAAYLISGFDSATAGEKTVVVTVGTQTVDFKVNVYKAAWTQDELDKFGNDLIYDLPYFLSFSLVENSLKDANDASKTLYSWYEARSEFAVTDDELEDYADAIEAIRTEKDEKAWKPYELVGTKNLYTDEVEDLGFDITAPIYQYSRQYGDEAKYNYFQIVTIGLDAEGKLLVATTICDFPYRGYAYEGKGYYCLQTDSETGQQWNLVEEIYYDIMDTRAQETFDGVSGYTENIFLPEAKTTTENCAYYVPAINAPYAMANPDSSLFDIATCQLEFNKGNNAGSYTQAELDAVLAKYTAKGIEVVTDSTSYSITVYTVNFESNGYDLELMYYLIQGDIVVEIGFAGYTKPEVVGTMTPKDIITYVASKFSGDVEDEGDGAWSTGGAFSAADYSVDYMKTLVGRIFVPAEFTLVQDWANDTFNDGTPIEFCVYKNSLNTYVEFVVYSYTFSWGDATVLQAYAYTK